MELFGGGHMALGPRIRLSLGRGGGVGSNFDEGIRSKAHVWTILLVSTALRP